MAGFIRWIVLFDSHPRGRRSPVHPAVSVPGARFVPLRQQPSAVYCVDGIFRMNSTPDQGRGNTVSIGLFCAALVAHFWFACAGWGNSLIDIH
jgi:hypothetical protein